MININSNDFNFDTFLGGKKEVKSLTLGAKEYGGATMINNRIYSNIETDSNIIINDNNNTVAIFIPSTINTDVNINNKKYVNFTIDYINNLYDANNNIAYENTRGSWYSDDLKKVVIENITIISVTLKTVTKKDIRNFEVLANFIKKVMKQEAVSITINDSLAIV